MNLNSNIIWYFIRFHMNQKTIAIAAVLAAALLTGIFSTTPMAVYAEDDYDNDHDDEERDGDRDHDDEERDYDRDHDEEDGYKGGDESETNTEQKLKQKNVGSGESTNFNCGENNIDAAVPIQACGTIDASVVELLAGLTGQ
jgi:Ni/Co efflux regulator RcnB